MKGQLSKTLITLPHTYSLLRVVCTLMYTQRYVLRTSWSTIYSLWPKVIVHTDQPCCADCACLTRYNDNATEPRRASGKFCCCVFFFCSPASAQQENLIISDYCGIFPLCEGRLDPLYSVMYCLRMRGEEFSCGVKSRILERDPPPRPRVFSASDVKPPAAVCLFALGWLRS